MDPRFTTVFASCEKKSNVFYIPPTFNEKCCVPGYREKRVDKGYFLTVNDYPLHPIQHSNGMWDTVVNSNR